jgi:cytochrome c553
MKKTLGNHCMKTLLRAAAIAALWPMLAGAQSAPATADETGYVWNEMTAEMLTALKAKGDAVRGKVSFDVCVGCHRPGAVGRVSGAYPRLAGQHATVLIKQMTDIRAGRRSNPKMDPFVDGHVISPQEIADLAVYLQSLQSPVANGVGPGTALALGQERYQKDCASCHGEKGEGSATKFYPRVAGQHYKYLLREIHMIWSGDRRNGNPEMLKVIKPYKDGEMDAVADYMSRLPQQ